MRSHSRGLPVDLDSRLGVMFSAGLATVMPTTSRVEGDFSLMYYRRNSYCSAMPEFSLEGVTYSKQYDALKRVAIGLQYSEDSFHIEWMNSEQV
jgi:hypothetical protein